MKDYIDYSITKPQLAPIDTTGLEELTDVDLNIKPGILIIIDPAER